MLSQQHIFPCQSDLLVMVSMEMGSLKESIHGFKARMFSMYVH